MKQVPWKTTWLRSARTVQHALVLLMFGTVAGGSLGSHPPKKWAPALLSLPDLLKCDIIEDYQATSGYHRWSYHSKTSTCFSVSASGLHWLRQRALSSAGIPKEWPTERGDAQSAVERQSGAKRKMLLFSRSFLQFCFSSFQAGGMFCGDVKKFESWLCVGF